MTLGAAAYVLGIGRTPFGTDSWVDAIFLAYGGLMMIPVFLALARILGQRAPIFSMICAVGGLCWALSLGPATLKLTQMDIINAGLNESIWAVSASFAGWTPLFIGVGLLHLTPLLLGIGLLWTGTFSFRFSLGFFPDAGSLCGRFCGGLQLPGDFIYRDRSVNLLGVNDACLCHYDDHRTCGCSAGVLGVGRSDPVAAGYRLAG